MTHQPTLFGDDYAAALATIKVSKVPVPIVAQHLKYGLKPGETCGTCRGWLAMWQGWPVREHHYCWRAFSAASVPAETPGCGKWERR